VKYDLTLYGRIGRGQRGKWYRSVRFEDSHEVLSTAPLRSVTDPCGGSSAARSSGREVQARPLQEVAFVLIYDKCRTNRDSETGSRPFKCLCTTVTRRNMTQGEINGRLNTNNAYCHWVRSFVFLTISENVKIRTCKNVAFCDIKPQFVPHTRHITSPLQSSAC
jgi:hypothetical protein